MQTTSERALVSIYGSPRRAEMYLYVPRNRALEELPDTLLTYFGTPRHVMDLMLTRDKRLARVDAGRVLDQLVEQGYYLQMPPAKEDYMLNLHRDPEGQ